MLAHHVSHYYGRRMVPELAGVISPSCKLGNQLQTCKYQLLKYELADMG